MRFQLHDCIFFQLAKASQIGTRFWAARVADCDITPAQAMVINCLGQHDHISARELASYTSLDRATLTGILDRLEAAGYLQRRPHPEDRRAQIIALSQDGKTLAEKLHARMIEANRDFLQPLEENERRMLTDLLAKIRENAGGGLPQNPKKGEDS